MLNKNVFSLKQTPVDKFRLTCSQIFLFLCVCLCTLTIFFNVTYSIAPVSGFSMYPTLNNYTTYSKHDRVVLNYIKAYHKGDIIVAKKIYDDEEHFIYVIKRLIATGGDSIEIKENGDVYVNDQKLDESYVTSEYKTATYEAFIKLKEGTNPNFDEKNDFTSWFEDGKLVLKPGYVFYLGDNRGGSTDCSIYGPVKEDNIIAKVDFVIKDGENTFVSILKQIFR